LSVSSKKLDEYKNEIEELSAGFGIETTLDLVKITN